jgi:hypothetical protein
MRPKKISYNDRMNDEEYRLNRDILDEIVNPQINTTKSSYKRNFLI